jgi:hypothetical protein
MGISNSFNPSPRRKSNLETNLTNKTNQRGRATAHTQTVGHN